MVRTDRANVAGRPCHVVGTASVALAFRRNSRADAVDGRYWLARVGRIDQVGRPKRLADMMKLSGGRVARCDERPTFVLGRLAEMES